MGNRHCIESAVLNISYASEELALAQTNQLEEFARKEMLAIVDEVFNEFSAEDSIQYFDKIEIDLGEISVAYFHQEFASKLKEEIRDCLTIELSQEGSSSDSNYRKISHNNSELNLICQFLSTGKLPWNAKLNHPYDIENLFANVVRENLDPLIEFIRNSSSRNEILSRLSEQFSHDTLRALFVRLSGIGLDEFRTLYELILLLSTDHFSFPRRRMESRVWADLLQSVLLDRSGGMDEKKLVRQLVDSIAVHVPHRYSVFITRMLHLAQGNPRSENLAKYLEHIAKEEPDLDNLKIDNSVMGETASDAIGGIESSQDKVRTELLALKGKLVEALDSGNTSQIEPSWPFYLSSHGELLRNLILNLGQKQSTRRNIARRFSDEMIRDIVALLEPTNYKFIEHFVNEPIHYLQDKEESNLSHTDSKNSLWEFTLTYLIVERGSRFNKLSYIESMMTKLAANLNIRIPELYSSLTALLKTVSNNDPMVSELLSVLGELGAKNSHSSEFLKRSTANTPSKVIDTLEEEPNSLQASPSAQALHALELAFSGVDLSELKAVWKMLLSHHRKWLVAKFHEVGKVESVRKNVSKSFSNLMFKELIFLIEPANGEFLVQMLHKSTSTPSSKGKRQELPQKRKRVVREFTLSYLLVDRGSQFNKRTYMSGLLRKIASHENVSIDSVLEMITESVQNVAYLKPMQKEILRLFSEVSKELNVNQASTITKVNSVNSLSSVDVNSRLERSEHDSSQDSEAKEFEQLELIRAYLLYEKLVTSIATTNSHGGRISHHIVRLFHELIENYPWILHRVNQEIGMGLISLTPVLNQLPVPLQRKLLLSYFSSMASRFSFNQKEFLERLEEIEKFGSLSKELHVAIFELLSSNKYQHLDDVFDIEAFQQRKIHENTDSTKSFNDGSVEQSPQHGFHQSIDPYEAAPLQLNKGTGDLLKSYLLGQLNISEQDKLTIASTLELMLSSHPNSLANILGDCLLTKAASDRLVAILPESLLVKLMLLLRPDDRFKVILYADLMTMAAVDIEREISVSSASLHIAKWQFILNYMVIEGRRFDEVSFVRMFSDYLFKRHTAKSQQEFVGKLSDSINLSSSPSTHIAGVRVAMILGSGSIVTPTEDKITTQTFVRSSVDADLENDIQSAVSESRMDFFDDDQDSKIDEDVYVNNAGLVLLAPYLPRYFQMLGLIEANKFKNGEAAQRAVHLLQYLTDESASSFEYQLVLNKLLCGVKSGVPIIKGIEVSVQEKEASESLLQGITANWPVLKNTSIDGLRETFLQRDAHLQLKNDAWYLLVESKPFDMLLDSIPWSFSTIKLSWMKRPIHVDWR